jgi:hypothetical protein
MGASSSGWAGVFFGRTGVSGDLLLYGNFTVVPPGAKSMAARHPDGSYRRLYSLESPETWFEDFGRAELVNGRSHVELDRDYAVLVQLEDYYVFLTPEGDSGGLYIAGKSPTSFEVGEQQGGTSSFDLQLPGGGQTQGRPRRTAGKDRCAGDFAAR